MAKITEILKLHSFKHCDIAHLLSATDPRQVEKIRNHAFAILDKECGLDVYYRGLIEFSNICINDCYYCGIRKGVTTINRYLLSYDQIIGAAVWCASQGYGSVVLQSGERKDEQFISFVEQSVRGIKRETVSEKLPHGLGITLCVGEQSEHTYERFYNAGAHRYLLRIETSSPCMFTKIHPPYQRFEHRVECLKTLKKIGFQVGTGVMIGLPGQTIEDLARDILFFRDMNVDMIGMGPYIPHAATPMVSWERASGISSPDVFKLSLLMIAVCRIVLRDVNIAATTALQAMEPDGREQGLQYGANIIMPQLTPQEFRHDYLLYEGKPCLDESAERCRCCLESRIKGIGRTIGIDSWGDSRHALRKEP